MFFKGIECFALTYDRHLLRLNECVERLVCDDLAAVGARVAVVDRGQVQGATGGERLLRVSISLKIGEV